MRRALAPSKFETRLDNLMWASPEETPIGSAGARDRASAGTSCVSPSATDAARHRAQSSESIPEPPAASPSVRHRGNPSCVPAVRDWTAPAPIAAFPTSVLPLPLLTYWLPVPFQCFPHWFPRLRLRFHDHLIESLLEQPSNQLSQVFGFLPLIL